jgi:hypothetical protein
MEILQQIGAVAGIAAFLGVAVLALLYFVQGRDVRRLRENAEYLVENPEAAADTSRAEGFRRAELTRQATERKERMLERTAGARGRLPDGRVLAVIAIGALLLIGGVVFAITRGGGSDSGQSAGGDAANTQVAVLNSTSSAGLAAEYANRVKKLGYRVTPVGNSDQPFDSSVVYFEPAGEDEAGDVASAVGVGVIQPISSEIRPQAGGASVVVVLGSDKASGV